MKRAATMTALMVSVLLAGGCREEPTAANAGIAETSATADMPELTPEELGELGAAIKKEPARADELLAQRSLNRQSFEKAIRDLTEDPDKSKRYAEAYRNAGG